MSEDDQIIEPAPTGAAQADSTAGAHPDIPGDGAATTDSPQSAKERIAELERLLAAERDAATDYMQRWQRAAADFSNYKRRAQQEQEQRERLMAAQALAPVLNALDSFERAFTALPGSLRSYTWIEGVALVEYQLRHALDAQGITEVDAEPGQPFDPTRHQAVGEIESSEHPAGHIAMVIQRGYQSASLLIRPALVQVARAPEAAQTETGQTTAEGKPGTTSDMSATPEETQPSGPAP